jgi:hypothetical protein
MGAVLARNSVVAVGVGIAHPIARGVLASVTGWGEVVQEYSVGYNMTTMMAYNAMGEGFSDVGCHFGNSPFEAYPAFWRAAGLLAAYGLTFVAVAIYSFRKRDLTA